MLLDVQFGRALRLILRPHRTAVAVLIILGFLASLTEGVGIGLFIPLLQSLEPQSSAVINDNWFAENLAGLFDEVSTERRVLVIAALIFAAVTIKALLAYTTVYLFSKLSARTGHELRTQVFEKVLAVDFGLLTSIGTGRFLNALSYECWRSADAAITYVQAIITLCTLAVYLALLLLISWKLTIVVAILVVLMAAVVRLITKRVGVYGKKRVKANAEIAGRMTDGVQGIEIIRGYGQEDFERSRFSEVSSRLKGLTVRTETMFGAVYPLYEIFAALIFVVVLFSSIESATGVASMLVFIFVMFRLIPVVKQFERQRIQLVASEGAVDEILSIIDLGQDNTVESGNQQFDGLKNEVRLEHVSYRYQSNAAPAINDICLQIPATGLTAIVGPSGAGKSTLVKLLLRFYDPTEGSVLVDGQALTDLDLGMWRSHIALVPQKAFLFSATVRDNIAYGATQFSDDEVIAAAKSAGAHDFIVALPQGYETKLGSHGVELSGGEGQRISLARALIRSPEVMLLDEATNALDNITEAFIHQALDELRSKCSVIVIAHRLSTIESADQILVMDEGKLVEQGTYAQLQSQDGLFAQLSKRLISNGQ